MTARLLLSFAALLGLSLQATVFDGCGCGAAMETFNLTTSAYCPISSYPSCDPPLLTETSCSLSCPRSRALIAYRNATAVWLVTKSITCASGVMTNSNGAKITALMRPTCAQQSLCNACPYTLETTACPANQTCNPSNLKVEADPVDDCNRIYCDNSATLTIYDADKNVMPSLGPKLYCTVANKWQNYSLNGGTSGGTAVNGTFSVNCRLPASCETCIDPALITSPNTELPVAFRTGYNTANLILTRIAQQCSTLSCPNGFLLMGFVGTTANQTGLEWTSQNNMLCSSNGLWTNGGFSYTPQGMKAICMQKILPCPPVDTVLGTTFTVNCDETTKVSTLTCPTGQKLVMRYSTQTSTVRFDKATFFAGKGWLAHGCEATAALFTTTAGQAISGVCA